MLGWSRCEANIRDCSPRLLILSLDTATDIATACVWRDGRALAESASRARSVAAQRVLADVDGLMHEVGVAPSDLDLVVAGTGPGTFTGLRIGLAAARALGFALGIPVKGVSTLAALSAGKGVEVACVDARRGEVFAAGAGLEPQAIAPEDLAAAVPAGTVCAGDGAIRYRDRLAGLQIPPDDSPLHVPWARHHAALAGSAGPPEPIYLRAPDADRALAARAAS
jgi:tRNA threonylcarbamoyladenosine biosynthesis protein TsaB